MNWLAATRAVAHATVAAVITFSQVHNGELGLRTLILFGVLYLAASLGTHLLDNRNKVMSLRLALPTIAPVITAIVAIVAVFTNLPALATFRWLVVALTLSFALIEFALYRKFGKKSSDGLDALIAGVASIAMFGIAAGINTGEVPLIGFFGAFNVILAVHLGIVATTPKK